MLDSLLELGERERSRPILRVHRIDMIKRNRDFFMRIAKERGRSSGFVLKSDAYGFGLGPMTRLLSDGGAGTIFTSDVNEGLIIRDSAGQQEIDIYTLHGFNRDVANIYLDNNIIPVLNSPDEIRSYASLAQARNRPLPAAIQLDTGMNRCGLSQEEAFRLAPEFNSLSRMIDFKLLMTHLYSVEETFNARQAISRNQICFMNMLREIFPGVPISITATHGTVYFEKDKSRNVHQDIDRVGIGLYRGPLGQDSCLEVYARLKQVRRVKAGETIGYDGIFRVPHDMRVGVVDIGYGDGYPRLCGNSTFTSGFMSVAGQPVPIVGHVAMNMTCIDLSYIEENKAQVGKLVEVLGPGVSPACLAKIALTIPEDIIISLNRASARVHTLIHEGV